MKRVLVLIGLNSCAGKSGGRNADDADTQFHEHKSLFATIHEGDKLTLYEGLPHQFDERRKWEEEKQSKKTVELHGFLFYRETLDLGVADEKQLKDLLGDEKSFRPWMGEKKCGGYHPDYCVEWYANGEVYQCSICLGCGEVKIYSPTSGLRCDIRREPEEQLKVILSKYRKNRPASKSIR
jgi:hypothetical protein